MKFRAPKYSCTICGKMFRRKKPHFRHVMRNTCGNKKISTGRAKTMTLVEIQKTYPEQQYFGKPYNFINIPTGNRHLRSGIPLPRLSSYRSAAI